MQDIIQLLPDPVANQIAAGEVIQRPASVVKELLENAVDAGAENIQLIVKDSGKTLINVIDDGCGMSETDARLCFERHATSKIRSADDLFSIHSFGFRGEAMASIAAIAQVEMKSRRKEDELATQVFIEGSEVTSQERCAHPAGTSIAVKNIFFNVPARRRFLKSDQVEMRHIILEFQRVALPNSSISFTLYHNDAEVFRLPCAKFKKRIIDIFGKGHNDKLVPIEVESSIVRLNGFVSKPESAKKTRGEQFLFVNRRFIKHAYLNHAVFSAFDGLIRPDVYPSFFIQMDVNPNMVDVNIHPTKNEVKFEDEKALYAIIRSGMKQALGKHNITPSLDFNRDPAFDLPPDKRNQPVKIPEVKINPDYNPFSKAGSGKPGGKPAPRRASGWENLFVENSQISPDAPKVVELQWSGDDEEPTESRQVLYQLHNKYILTNVRSGFMVIHQQRAHARILYEQFLKGTIHGKKSSQQELFPQPVELSPTDADLVCQLLEDICSLGIDIRQLGKNTFAIHGLPADTKDEDPRAMIETILEHYKRNMSDLMLESRESLARSMASNLSIRSGKKLSDAEMHNLIDDLFSCEIPHTSPNGKLIISMLTLEDIDERFN